MAEARASPALGLQADCADPLRATRPLRISGRRRRLDSLVKIAASVPVVSWISGQRRFLGAGPTGRARCDSKQALTNRLVVRSSRCWKPGRALCWSRLAGWSAVTSSTAPYGDGRHPPVAGRLHRQCRGSGRSEARWIIAVFVKRRTEGSMPLGTRHWRDLSPTRLEVQTPNQQLTSRPSKSRTTSAAA